MGLKQLLAIGATALTALFTCAADMSARSAFVQGHWWDPGHSGHGFELLSTTGGVMAVWYTYDEAGRPVWYTAQGPMAEMGQAAWALQKHTWSGGRIASSATVGEMTLVVNHAEEIKAQWRLGASAGSWTLRPYVASSVLSEVDHSGHWFDPSQSGWGFTLTEQGNTLGSVLYAYDPSGAPTWIAGFDRGTGNRVALYALTGTSPAATYLAPTARPVGHIDFEYQGESRLVVRPALSIALAADLKLMGAQATQLGRPASLRAADRQLARFDSEGLLKAYLDSGMMDAPAANGGIDFSAPPPAATFSPTNLQEAGVDEADLVKTDGRFVYAFAHVSGRAVPTLRYAQLGPDGASLGQKGSVDFLDGGNSASMSYAGMFAHAGKVAAITSSVASGGSDPWYYSNAWTNGATRVEIFDTTESGAPVTRWRAKIDGHVLATRRVGNLLYIVTRNVPAVPDFYFGAYDEQTRSANRSLLAATPLHALLPKVSIDGGAPAALLDAGSVYAPPSGAGLRMPDLISTVAIDITNPRIVQAIAVAGAADTVYAAPGNLYIATSRSPPYLPNRGGLQSGYGLYLTDINRIALSPSGMAVAGTGTVEGMLSSSPEMRPLRMSEKDGRLRVVTTSFSMWDSGASHRLTVLEPSTVAPGLLKVLSWLPNERRPQPLGKPGEELKATRFVGDRLFAVTFLRVDPLYVVDLSRPADPQIAGLLEMPGFAEYLHPLPNGQLLGFGRDATPMGVATGLMLALYNFDSGGTPIEVQRMSLGAAGSLSALLEQPHAFSALMRADTSGTIAFPARINTLSTPPLSPVSSWDFSGVLRFDLLRATPTELRLVPAQSLVSHTRASSSIPYYQDPAATNGRSILFPKGTVYVGDGRFWHLDEAGVTTGPF